VSWGLGEWGLDEWGGLPGPLNIVSALALSTRVVRVTLSTTPKAFSTTASGDALNPSVWTITRPDTGQVFTIASIDQVTAVDFDITVVEPFGSISVSHEVSSTMLEKPTGELISTPYSALFNGIAAVGQDALSKRQQKDIANPQTSPGATGLGGTLVMTSAGDYALVSGAELVKKLIIRRLITRPGEFSHLPTYGIGLAVKEPVSTSSLILLRREVERQVLEEPEVEAAQVALIIEPASGILTVNVRAKLTPTGESIETSFKLPTVGVT
jgi:hypothetical protein